MSTPTSTTTPTGVTYIRYNGDYIHTVPGLLKIVCLVLDLVGFICIQVSKFGHQPRGSFFSTVAMTGFWFTGIMFLLYLFQIVYKAQRIPWLQIEMWFSAAITLFFLLASALAADMGSGAYIAAAFFGFCAMCVYGYDAFLKYRLLQGATVVVQRTTVITSTTQVA